MNRQKKVEPVDIDDLVGMALGGMGMSLDDFERCTPIEFEAAFRSWEQNHCQDDWERARFLACCMLQPYSKKALKTEDVCRFPWDIRNSQVAAPAEESTWERFEELVRRLEKDQ